MGGLLLVLGDGNDLRLAVGGAGTGEDDPVYLRRPHGVQEREGSHDVVLIVSGRVGDRDAPPGPRRRSA